MRRVDSDPEIGWLISQDDEGGRTTGFDAGGWAASVWVLHAMYETDQLPSGLSYDEARRIELGAGTAKPLIVGKTNIDELPGMRVVGASLGASEWPGPGWVRLMWLDLAARLNTDPFQVAPGFRSFRFPGGSWPVNIRPPAEGSLDREQFACVRKHLADLYGGDVPVFAYYALLANADWGNGDTLFRGSLAELGALYDDPTLRGSPSNIWPDDRAWFVYSHCDAWGTKVSGSEELIARLTGDEILDTAPLHQ